MALLFCDSMEHYFYEPGASVTNTVYERKYNRNINAYNDFADATSQPSYETDIVGGWCIRAGINTNSRIHYKAINAGTATGIVGFWFKSTVTLGTGNILMRLMDGTSEQVSIRGDGLGHITFTRNGTVLATSTNTISANTWYHCEFKCKIDPSTGTYEVKINGSSVNWIAAATGVNTRATANSSWNGIGFGTSNSGQQYFKSIVVADSSGSYANDFMGITKVSCLRAQKAGNYAQWSSMGLSRRDNVGDLLGDPLAFNFSDTVNNLDTFVFDDVPYSGTIYGIQHVFFGATGGAKARGIKAMQRSSGTDYASSTELFLPGSFNTYLMDPISVDPSTSVAFTETTVNAAEFGYKLTT